MRDARGAVIGAMAIGRDITTRYLEERERRAHIEALEARLRALQKK